MILNIAKFWELMVTFNFETNNNYRYRKIASNKCVGGVENSGKYELLNISCPVYKPEGLSLSIEHDTVATGSSIVFKLSQVKVKFNCFLK